MGSFKIGDDYIVVKFMSGDIYKYSYASAGAEAIEEVKWHALANEGLAVLKQAVNCNSNVSFKVVFCDSAPY